jgi:hypothetical protein
MMEEIFVDQMQMLRISQREKETEKETEKEKDLGTEREYDHEAETVFSLYPPNLVNREKYRQMIEKERKTNVLESLFDFAGYHFEIEKETDRDEVEGKDKGGREKGDGELQGKERINKYGCAYGSTTTFDQDLVLSQIPAMKAFYAMYPKVFEQVKEIVKERLHAIGLEEKQMHFMYRL